MLLHSRVSDTSAFRVALSLSLTSLQLSTFLTVFFSLLTVSEVFRLSSIFKFCFFYTVVFCSCQVCASACRGTRNQRDGLSSVTPYLDEIGPSCTPPTPCCLKNMSSALVMNESHLPAFSRCSCVPRRGNEREGILNARQVKLFRDGAINSVNSRSSSAAAVWLSTWAEGEAPVRAPGRRCHQ